MPKGDDATLDAQTVGFDGPPEPLECATCGRLFDGDPEEDPIGESGLPMCGECNRTRKEKSLLTGPDGSMSCVEVEVVRLLRVRWQAGWVQGFPCGRNRWGSSIWTELPQPVAVLNRRVQEARGQPRSSSFSGHPDVAVTDGRRVAYVECKMDDQLKPSQVSWFGTAFAGQIVRPEDVLVIRGVDALGPSESVRWP